MERLIPIVSNEWYHVYNRGNDRRTLFHDAADYRAFLTKMDAMTTKYHIERIAYVLMPNHFHAIFLQRPEGDLPHLMISLGTSYAKRYNLRHGHSGHTFEGRYRYSYIPSEQALWNVARYIHLNPVRAGLVKSPEEWPWSDFRTFGEGVLHQGSVFAEGRLPPRSIDYAAFVADGVKDVEDIRRFLFDTEFKASFNNDNP